MGFLNLLWLCTLQRQRPAAFAVAVIPANAGIQAVQ
jgi:hypothetical protein